MISLMTVRRVVMLLQGDGVHYADVDDVGFAGDGHADDVVVNDDWRFRFFCSFQCISEDSELVEGCGSSDNISHGIVVAVNTRRAQTSSQ